MNVTCMIGGENLFVMLLVEKFFSTFTQKAIADTGKVTEVLTWELVYMTGAPPEHLNK
jgi:predicted lactoylglutathione lyase